jgi:hypothetical protein
MSVLNVYPLDPTGTNVNNLVRGESAVVKTIGPRFVAPRYGAFFAESLKIKDVNSNTLLRPDQFYATWRYKVPTSLFKKDVCGLIVITDAGISNNLLIDYQVVGDVYSASEEAIVDLISRRLTGVRSAGWHPILAKPPALLLKDFTDDEYGFARVENALNDVATTMVDSNPLAQDAVYGYVDVKAAPYLNAASPAFATELANHKIKGDPHPYYLRKTELAAIIPKVFAPVRRPKHLLPVDRAVAVALKPTLEANTYRALYGIPQAKMQVQIATDSAFTKFVLDQTTTTPVTKYTVSINLITKTKYFWRVRYQNTEAQWSEWSYTTSFTTV